MSELRLTCITFEYPPDKGGIASYLHGLLSTLPIQITVLRADTRAYWPRWWPVIKQCHTSKAEMLLTSHLLPIGTAAWLAHLVGGPPYILVVHGMDVLLASRSPWKRWFAKHVIANAYLVIANSAYTARLTEERFQRQSLVLTPGYTPRPLLTRAEARARLGVAQKEYIILSVGRLVSRKGFDTLIEATSDIDATLVIIGDGPEKDRLKSKIITAYSGTPPKAVENQKSKILLIDNASDQERDLWYAAANAFALLVREEKNDVEGFGIVYLEAAAAGLPIVAGRSGGVSEAIEDTVTGTLVDPHSPGEAKRALQFFLEHPTAAEDMGRAGQKRVQKYFAWDDRARSLLAQLPLISVIIPVFNRSQSFRRCLAALAKQSYRYREVIVIDDGSTEDIQSIANEYQNHLHLRYIRQQNQGAPAARNRGFEAAKGDYVLFLDADVLLIPVALECMARTATEHPDADVVYGDHRFGWKLFRGRPFSQAALQRGNFIHTSALIRRAAFPGFDQALRRFQDWDVWLTMAKQGAQFVWLPRVLFRVETGGTMSAWLPAFVHRLPWKRLGWTPRALKTYQDAERIIKTKHLIH